MTFRYYGENIGLLPCLILNKNNVLRTIQYTDIYMISNLFMKTSSFSGLVAGQLLQ